MGANGQLRMSDYRAAVRPLGGTGRGWIQCLSSLHPVLEGFGNFTAVYFLVTLCLSLA